ncbi:MAG: PLP-dependent transferase [Planctomycetes bacterium]|nr:PLP-dependent transferase [Planctomycetota bacterium]
MSSTASNPSAAGNSNNRNLATELIRNSGDANDPYAAAAPPLYQTATFHQSDPLTGSEYDYTRSGNPTRNLLQQQLARLEQATTSLAYNTGMAALTALTRLVPLGGRILAGDDLYGGCWRLLSQITAASGIEIQYLDTTNADALNDALAIGADLLLVESPTNPRMRVTDIRLAARLCRRYDCLLAVDNSLMSPLRQQPLELGAHVVMNSATKFLGGHSDVSAGVLSTRDAKIAERLAFIQNAEGTALAPFECWLLLRGLKTLPLRINQQEQNARLLAEYLQTQPLVKNLRWPGALEGEQARIHSSQSNGPGTVLSFETGCVQTSAAWIRHLQCFSIAVSFGSLESTVSLPCRMSHAAIPSAERAALALPEDLIRISVGAEHGPDLKNDLQQAFGASRFERNPSGLSFGLLHGS